MSTTMLQAVGAGLLFLFIFASGIGLSQLGRPLNVGVSTLHKLISLAMGVFLVVTVIQINKAAPLRAIEWVLVVVTVLLFLGDVATGGILSSENPMPTFVLRLHQVLPVLTVISTGVLLYLLLGRT